MLLRLRLDLFNRLRQIKRVVFLYHVRNGLLRRGRRIVPPLARYKRLSKGNIRAVRRIFTRASIPSNLHRVSVNDHRGTCVNLACVTQASASVFSNLRRPRRANLNDRKRLSRFVRRRHATVNDPRVAFTFARDPHGNAFLVPRRFKVSNAFKCKAAVSHGVFLILAPTIIISSAKGRFLSSSTFSNGRSERINLNRLRNSIRHVIRPFKISRSTVFSFLYRCVYHGRGLSYR